MAWKACCSEAIAGRRPAVARSGVMSCALGRAHDVSILMGISEELARSHVIE